MQRAGNQSRCFEDVKATRLDRDLGFIHATLCSCMCWLQADRSLGLRLIRASVGGAVLASRAPDEEKLAFSRRSPCRAWMRRFSSALWMYLCDSSWVAVLPGQRQQRPQRLQRPQQR